VRFVIEVRGQLVGQVALGPAGRDERAETQTQASSGHGQASLRTRSMADVMRAHALVSTAS
jgi:hypothetical protein